MPDTEVTTKTVANSNNSDLAKTLVERAKAIAPRIAERAQLAEAERRIPDETIREVADAGLFQILVPKKYGGHELGIPQMVEVMKVLSPLDVSTGWTLSFYMIHNWMWSLLPEQAQQEIFSDTPYTLGPVMVAPTVRATPVDGGYRINGQAKWGTGSSHATWCMVSGIVQESGDKKSPGGGPPKPPQVLMFAMPWADAKCVDTWRTSGMAATASHDVIFDNVFIPEHRVMDAAPARSGESLGATLHAGHVYKTAFTPALVIAALAPMVAGTKGVADHALQRSKEFLSTYTGQSSVDNPALQIRLAKANLMADAAMTLITQLAADIEADSLQGPVPIKRRAHQRAQASYIANLCRECATLIAQGSGASGHMLDSPIQRAFRDLNMAACHVVFDHDPTMELHGKMLLDRPPAFIMA